MEYGGFVMVDIDKALKSIASDAGKRRALRVIITDAVNSNDQQTFEAAAQRMAELEKFTLNSPFDEEMYHALLIAELYATKKNGRTTLLSRTRQKIKRESFLKFAKAMLDPSKHLGKGFDILRQNNALEFTCEAIALKHRELFDNFEIAVAELRLKQG